MTYIEWLLVRAGMYWGEDVPLPLDLFAEMNAAGIAVELEEETFHLMNQYDN